MVPIRLLQEHDEPEWMRLRFALWPHYTLAEMRDEMASLRGDLDNQPVFVAAAPDVGLCGLMEVSIHTSAPGCTTDRIGFLEAWYVDPAWRKQGIGRRLVEVAERWARSRGCREMASDTDQGYPLSPTAHTRLGYTIVARMETGEIFFRKDLVPTPRPPDGEHRGYP
jgi:aminoglycoside 6'-N-acetyltransferase I